MRFHDYDPKCPHCTPAFIDAKTGRVRDNADPFVRSAMALWWKQPEDVRRAFIAVTANNSRTMSNLILAQVYIDAIEKLGTN